MSPLESRFRELCNDSLTDFYPNFGQMPNESVMVALIEEMTHLPFKANYVLRMHTIKAHLIWGTLDLYPSLQWLPEERKATFRNYGGMFLNGEVFLRLDRYGANWTRWPWLHEMGHAISFLCSFTNEAEQPEVLATHRELVARNALRPEERDSWNEWVAQAIARRWLGIDADRLEVQFWRLKLALAGVD